MIAPNVATSPIGATYVRIDTHTPLNPGYLRAKRVLDLVLTIPLLIPLAVIFLIMLVVIRLDSKGPVLFRQKRVGQYGVEFEFLKFRSMRVESDDTIHRAAYSRYMRGEKLHEDPENKSPYKLMRDPRITPVGRFIRKTGIDELPQLWNVVKGDMTLVGPRPPLAYEVAMYDSHDLLRLSGRPGITGPWQVYGRSEVGFHEMVEMDISYLRRQSLWEDLKLIAMTIPVMLLSRGGG